MHHRLDGQAAAGRPVPPGGLTGACRASLWRLRRQPHQPHRAEQACCQPGACALFGRAGALQSVLECWASCCRLFSRRRGPCQLFW